jgi:uncharacterized protein DUF4396
MTPTMSAPLESAAVTSAPLALALLAAVPASGDSTSGRGDSHASDAPTPASDGGDHPETPASSRLAFDILFQYFAIAPMRGLGVRGGLKAAAKADFISLTAFEIGLFGWMDDHDAGPVSRPA